MDDRDFLEGLADTDQGAKKAAQDFFMPKKAGAQQAAVEFVRQHATEIGAALAGGGVATMAQYMANRSRNGGESVQQHIGRKGVEAAESSISDSAAAGKLPTFKQDLAASTARGTKDISDTLARHPAKGALLALPLGVGAGWRIAKALT